MRPHGRSVYSPNLVLAALDLLVSLGVSPVSGVVFYADGVSVRTAETLLQWATRHRDHPPIATTRNHLDEELFLVGGVKTSVLHSFHYRQTLRETWMTPTNATAGSKVVFLGCQPDFSTLPLTNRTALEKAIAHEKEVFGDLLTTELGECVDGYKGLMEKAKLFFHWVTRTYPAAPYVMIADEDTYIRLEKLMEFLRREDTPTRRFFGGNSAINGIRGFAGPTRDPQHKSFMPVDVYPLAIYPPFVTGAHMIFSSDVAGFIGRNSHFLKGYGSLDDVFIGMWLFMALRLRPFYIDSLLVLNFERECDDTTVSYANVGIDGMHDRMCATTDAFAMGLSCEHGKRSNALQSLALSGSTSTLQVTTASYNGTSTWTLPHDASTFGSGSQRMVSQSTWCSHHHYSKSPPSFVIDSAPCSMTGCT